MKIFKVMPLFAALIILSACETAPKGGSGNGGGGSQGPEVIVKPGDNLDESGNIKPDAGSTTTQEFLEALGKGFRNRDLTPLSIKTNNGTYSYVAGEEGGVEILATLDSLKNSTHAIFRLDNVPLGGGVTLTQYIGIAILDGKAFWQFGWVNYYESDYPGNDAPPAQLKAHYEKLYAKNNIDWSKPVDIMAALPPAPADVSAFVTKVNTAALVNSRNTLFNLAADGSFSQGTSTLNIFYIPNDSTARYARDGEYGLRGKKFGRINYNYDNNGQQTSEERPMTFPIAIQKSDATDPAALDALKAALAGTYTPLIINNPSGVGEAPTTNDGTPFTINADGSFTDATLKIEGMDSTITAATLDSARSASEGRYTATVDGTAGRFIGFEIIDGMLYATSHSRSDINSIYWFNISPVAKKN